MIDIVDAPDLDPSCRLYRAESGRYIRVHIHMVAGGGAQGSRQCKMTAEAAEADGTATGHKLPPHMIVQALGEAPMRPFSEVESLPPSPVEGELVSLVGRLWEYMGGIWLDRGPIAVGASASLAEALALFDRTARTLVAEADLSFTRMDGDSEILSLLGQAAEN